MKYLHSSLHGYLQVLMLSLHHSHHIFSERVWVELTVHANVKMKFVTMEILAFNMLAVVAMATEFKQNNNF